MGLPVELKDGATGATITTVNTDGKGQYAFTGLADGKYLISFHNPLIWSPVIANFPGTNGTNDSDGPTDVLVEVKNGQITDGETIDQGFYNGSGAAVNDGKAPVLNDLSDITGTVNQPIPSVPVISTDNTTTTVKVDGLPPGMIFTPGTNQTTTTDGQIVITGEISGTPTQVGTYPVVITSTDIYGNETKENINIIVKDVPNDKPVLTVNDTTIPYGTAFDPLSIATATDANGDAVKITSDPSTIDTTKPGAVQVTYTADDGKDTVTKTVTLTVADKPNSAPVLEVQNAPIAYGEKIDLVSLAKATDADGDTVKITTNPTTIDTTKPGDVSVTYTADDGNGGITQKTVIYTVGEKPNDAPVLTVSDVFVDYGKDFDPLSMATATDADGDAIKITANPSKIDTTKPGTVTIEFTADDGNGGVVKKSGTVTVNAKPNSLPTLTVPAQYTATEGEKPDYMQGVSAYDEDQGDLTKDVKIDDSKVDYAKPGTYQVIISVTDGAGVTVTETRDVIIKENSLPRIIVSDQYIVQGSTFNPMDNVWAWDAEDQDLTDQVELISGNVDTSKVGNYDLTYRVEDKGHKVRERTVTITVGMDVQKAYDSLKAITDKLTSDMTAMNEKLNDHEDRLKTLEAQVAKNTGDIADLKAQLAEQQKQIDTIKTQIDALNDRIDAQQAQLDALKAQTDKNTADIAAQQKEIDALKSDVKDLQDRVTTLETKVTELEKQVAQNTSDIKSLNERLTTLEEKEKAVEDRLTVLEGKVDKNTSNIEALKTELSEIKKEIADIKIQIETLKSNVKDLQDADKAIQDKVKALESKLAELEKKASGISIQINNTNTNNNTGTKASYDNKDDSGSKNDTGNTGDNTADDNKSDVVTTPTKDDSQTPTSGTNATGSTSNGSGGSTTQPSTTTSGQTSDVSKPQQTKAAGILPDTGSAWSNTVVYGGIALMLLGVAGYMAVGRKTKEE